MVQTPPFPELAKQLAQVGAVLPNTAKGLQVFNLKMKAAGAAFGPFQDFFVKGKQAADLFGEVMGVTSESVEETNKTMTTFNETIETTMTIFGGIVKDVLILIGIFMAAVGVVAILAGSFANMNSVVPGSGDAFEMVKEAGALLWEQMQQLIAAFDGVGVSGETVKEALANIAGQAMTFLGVIISIYAAIATGYLQVFQMLADAGIFSTIIEGAMMLFGTIKETVGGVMEQLGIVSDGGQGLVENVRGFIASIIGFMESSGILELLNEYFEFFFQGLAAGIVIVGFLVRAVIAFFQETAPLWEYLISIVMVGFTVMGGALRIFFRFWSSVFKLITGDVDGFAEGILSLGDLFTETFDNILDALTNVADKGLTMIEPLLDAIEKVTGFDPAGAIGGAADKAAGLLGFSEGGIASGPSSGYPVNLHGTEAVVPLPNGRSIPVELSGAVRGAGGDTINLSINVSGGGGNPREVAKQVSEEVARVFKNRSRSSGFTRGL